jgi:hypothetical protein
MDMDNVSMQLSQYTGDDFTYEGKAETVLKVDRHSYYPLKTAKPPKIPKDTDE